VKKILVLCCLACLQGFAQGTRQDYDRARALQGRFSWGKVRNAGVDPHWLGGSRFWYRRQGTNGDEFVEIDAATTNRTLLEDEPKNGVTRPKPLAPKQLNPAPGRQRHWAARDDGKDSRDIPSPDGRYVASVRDCNVRVLEKATGKETALSDDGSPKDYYNAYLIWSPDSKKIAAVRFRPSEKRYITYVESSPRDQLQPKTFRIEYAKPGDPLPFKVPCIFEVDTGRKIIPDTALFDSQYDVSFPRWDGDSKAVTFEYNQRGHQVFRVLELSAETGKVRTLIEETSKTFVVYGRNYRYDSPDGKTIYWTSERDGYRHLYLFDRATGNIVRQITKGKWWLRDIIRIDEKAGLLWFSANGMRDGEDPYFLHYYKMRLDGTGLVELTPEPAMHNARFSPDFKYLVDTYSTVAQPPVSVVRDNETGGLVMRLEEADISALLREGWKPPEVFTAKGRDGVTDIWGIIVRPTNFDPAKKYPVIEDIYGGPGNQYVPKTFFSYDWDKTPLAELGFIVVQMDGMGTAFRSKAFEDVCWKNLKDAGFPDRIAWIKAAAAKHPEMDIGRMGIFGCSAGGQEAAGAMLFHGDFYKAGYAACGCHDNRMDKIWWNEQWMGYPIGKQYEECSNVVNAGKLRGALMLVLGELDDNVDPSSTMQLVNALIKANKDFELVVIPGAHHTMGEWYGEHKRFDFFVRNLLGVTPPKWN
jgi:dipeptidyl aminopeptidase/acylaminoacyl peptidase